MGKTSAPPILLADGFSPTDALHVRRRIAFQDDGAVWLARADGRGRRSLFQRASHSLNCPLAWSPDGRILYHSHDQIYAITVATGETRAVTDFAEEDQAGVVWHLACSPEGHTLSFFQLNGTPPRPRRPGRHRLCTIGTDGRGFRVVAEELPDARLWQVAVSWQSRQCLLTGTIPQQGMGIWKQGLDSGESMLLKRTQSRAELPAFSPNGREAVYADDGLRVIALADGRTRKISRIGRVPAWSPDGNWIAFMEDHALWVGTADGKELKKLAWFGGRNNFPQRKGSYAHPPVWSADSRLLWFGLTRTRRLKKPKNPEFLARLPHTDRLQQLPPDQRDQELRAAAERQLWDFIHMNGVIDFADGRVWTGSGYWSNVAWSPRSAG